MVQQESKESKESKESIVQRPRPAVHPPWVDLEGGDFVQGSDDFYPDEAPVRHAQVDAFAISATPVTNLQFAALHRGHRLCHRRRARSAGRAGHPGGPQISETLLPPHMHPDRWSSPGQKGLWT